MSIKVIFVNPLFWGLFVGIASLWMTGCLSSGSDPRVVENGYEFSTGTAFKVILKTPLGCNTNKRGDTFSAHLKDPVTVQGKVVLQEGTEFAGLVNRVTRYQKFGDRASLLLVFDQLLLPNEVAVPILASLDTRKGDASIRIPGKGLHTTKVVGQSAIIGAMIGKASLKEQGAEKGLVAGAAVGTSVVVLSEARAVSLPKGTELLIKIDAPLIVPQ